MLLDGFFPDQQSNQIFAKEIAQATMPTLDLYQEDGGRWPLLAAEARRSESRRSHKLNYRPYALLELDETPTRIRAGSPTLAGSDPKNAACLTSGVIAKPLRRSKLALGRRCLAS